MTKENLAKCEAGLKTQTRRDSERLAGIAKDDHIFFRSNYKTTYLTASGPYLARADAKWESLNDISEQDARAEGAEPFGLTGSGFRDGFQRLWDSIYKREGVRWEDNPRVLKIHFEKLF